MVETVTFREVNPKEGAQYDIAVQRWLSFGISESSSVDRKILTQAVIAFHMSLQMVSKRKITEKKMVQDLCGPSSGLYSPHWGCGTRTEFT